MNSDAIGFQINRSKFTTEHLFDLLGRCSTYGPWRFFSYFHLPCHLIHSWRFYLIRIPYYLMPVRTSQKPVMVCFLEGDSVVVDFFAGASSVNSGQKSSYPNATNSWNDRFSHPKQGRWHLH